MLLAWLGTDEVDKLNHGALKEEVCQPDQHQQRLRHRKEFMTWMQGLCPASLEIAESILRAERPIKAGVDIEGEPIQL
jgi:tRNA splicing endonuclease